MSSVPGRRDTRDQKSGANECACSRVRSISCYATGKTSVGWTGLSAETVCPSSVRTRPHGPLLALELGREFSVFRLRVSPCVWQFVPAQEGFTAFSVNVRESVQDLSDPQKLLKPHRRGFLRH